MIIKLFGFFGKILIGKIPPEKKEYYRQMLNEIIKSAAEGAVSGAAKR